MVGGGQGRIPKGSDIYTVWGEMQQCAGWEASGSCMGSTQRHASAAWAKWAQTAPLY